VSVSDKESKLIPKTNLKTTIQLYTRGVYLAFDFGHGAFHEPGMHLEPHELRMHNALVLSAHVK
jgi:hypothetical protein